MFKITNELIVKYCSNLVFNRGMEYYAQNKVKAITFNYEKMLFDSTVLGTRKYSVQAFFDPNGEFHRGVCTCPANESKWGICKHVVAVLLLIKERDMDGFFDDIMAKQLANNIFSYFQEKPAALKSIIKLEFAYELKKDRIGHRITNYSSLTIKIGLDKLYIIKNVKDFFDSLVRNREIYFGKKFCFDPSIHDFSEKDKKVLELIRELYEIEKISDSFGYGYVKSKIFDEKSVILTPAIVKRFFELMEGRTFNVVIFGELYKDIQIKNEDFSVNFTVTKDRQDLLLELDYKEPLLPLTEDGEYFFSGGTIYKVSKKQQEHFKPFYMAILRQKGKRIRFVHEDKERFVSEVLPFANKAGSVKIDNEIKELIKDIELEPEIYLDRSDGLVSADVRFKYEDRIINPFSALNKTLNDDSKIIIRDVEKERLIVDTLAEADFIVRNDKIYLDDEEKIFEFVFEVVPKLQEYADVYYSDNFKNIMIKATAAFTGGVRLNTVSNMLEISFNIEGIERSELFDILNSFKEKKRYYRLKSGKYLPLQSDEIADISEMATHLGLNKKDFTKEFIEIPKYRALYLDQHLRDSGLRYIERNHAFKEFVHNIIETEDTDLTIPSGIVGDLREYQRFGFKWLKTMSIYGLGGILADDMGLGKTLQVITLLLSEKKENGQMPSIVVVPTSLIYNWSDEIEKFAPELNYIIISGNKDERQKQREAIIGSDLVITSYPLIRRDIEEYIEMEFRFCIVDEAQHIKNPESQNAKSVKDIKAQKRFALTGTPMENSLTELWSIFDFVLPGYLFTHLKFSQKYERPIVKEKDNAAMGELRKLIRPFILRRLKSEVLNELPEKIEHNITAELSDEQKKVYLAYLEKIKKDIESDIKQVGFERSHIKILAGLTRLRQICCHPSLFLDNFNGESGKLQLLQEIVDESLESGHRILIFSQFTSMLRVIRDWLDTRQIEYMYLDGGTKTEDRGWMVKSFNNGNGKIFLISLKAGGTGLNLTGADTVIHYDPWWNPAVEDQATDRAYRIGQLKSVHVMKLITKGTIEEKIFKLQEKKRKLIDSVIQSGETLLSKMTEAEVRELFE